MKIKMLKNANGSPDGISVESYKAGEVYDITSESLVKVFISNNWAQICKETLDELKSESPAYEKKVMTSPKNKEAAVKEEEVK
jgi:hypothetical protein